MINEQHVTQESKESADHDEPSINQNSSKRSTAPIKEPVNDSNVSQGPRNVLDPFAKNSEAKEIGEIVEQIAKSVFRLIDNNFNQLANRSSNTLGMRVKDSLILKVQQTNRKRISFDTLKTSALVSQLIVDDDLQIRLLPRIESPAPSSGSDNSSTKRKKSVSLAEGVKVFDGVENESLNQSEIGFVNELRDSDNDRTMEQERTEESEDNMYDLTSLKGSNFTLESKSFADQYDEVRSDENDDATFSQDKKIHRSKTSSKDLERFELLTSSDDLKKFDELKESSTIFAMALNHNQIIVNLATESKKSKNLVSKSKETIQVQKDSNASIANESNDRFQEAETDNQKLSKLSKTVIEDREKVSLGGEERLDQVVPTASIIKPLILDFEVELKFHEEPSKIAKNSPNDDSNELMDDNQNDMKNIEAKKVAVKKSWTKTRRGKRSREDGRDNVENIDVVNGTERQNKKGSKQMTKLLKEFLHSQKKITGDKGKAENKLQQELEALESIKNSEKQSSTITVGIVAMETASTMLHPCQSALETNEEDKILGNEIPSVDLGSKKLENDEDTLKLDANLKFESSDNVDEKMNESGEISGEEEQSETLSKPKHVDIAKNADSEKVKSRKDKGVFQLFKKTFVAANVESENLVKLSITPSMEKQRSKNKNLKNVSLIQEGKSVNAGDKTLTNQGGKENNEINEDNSSSIPDTKDEPKSKSNDSKTGVARHQSTEKVTENQEIVKNSEKRSSLLSRIVRSKNRTQKSIASKKTAAIDEDAVTVKRNRALSEMADQISTDSQRLNNSSSEKDLVDGGKSSSSCDTSDNERKGVQRKNSRTLPKTESTESEELRELPVSREVLKIQSLFETKRNCPTNDPSSKESLPKVSPEANKLSKQLSITDSNGDQRSTNDPSLKETSSKVLRRASQSSGKLSRMDISDVISPGPNNSAVETLVVFSNDKNVSNQIANDLLVAETSASEKEMRCDKKLKSKKGSGSFFEKFKALAYPVTTENLLRVDKELKDQNLDNEMNKVEIKTNRSRRSLRSEKSSANLKCDNQKISEKVSLGHGTEDVLNPDRMKRQRSVLNVVSKSSLEGPTVIRDISQQENDRDNEDDKNSESFINPKTSKVRNISEDTLIAVQLYAVPLNTDGGKMDNPLEPSVNAKKRNRFIEGLKRRLRPKKKPPKRSEGKCETRLKVSSESQTDMEEELTTESFIQFRDGNYVGKSARSSQSIDTELSQSSGNIKRDSFITGKDEAQNISSQDDETNCSVNKSGSFDKLFKRSKEEKNEDNEITDPDVGDLIEKSILEETPEKKLQVYSVIIDRDSKQDRSVLPEINNLSSMLDSSPDLGEKNDCNTNKTDTKSISNDLELGVKFSEDLESDSEQIEKDNFILKVNKSLAKLWKKISLKESRKGIEDNEINETVNGEEYLSKKPETLEAKETTGSESKSGSDRITAQNSSSVFSKKSETMIIAYLENPSIRDQAGSQTIIEDKIQSDSIVMESEEKSRDLIRQDKERQSLLSNIKSIFKSLNKSESQKYSISSIEDLENTSGVKKSMRSSKPNQLSASPSKIEVEKELNVHFMEESVEVPMIQSTKSLQNNRKRSKNRKRPGHKLLDDEDVPFITAESTDQSNPRILVTDEEEGEEKTSQVSDRRKGSKKKQKNEGYAKKFAVSLSQIFSNSSRKRNTDNESRPISESQIDPEEHFEITKIPLSSSDDSDTQENDSQMRKQKSDPTEDTREELVAIKSLDSFHDSRSYTADRESVVKRSSKVSDLHNDAFVFSAAVEENQMSSQNQLATQQSLQSVQETGKPSEKVYATKGTIVSYAPMVESAKYIKDECDDRFNDDDQPDKREKRSSAGRSFATIRKLFSKASVQRSRQDHTAPEDQMEVKRDSLKSGKSSVIKHRENMDHSSDQLNHEAQWESIASKEITEARNVKDKDDADEKRKSHHEIKKPASKSKLKIRQARGTDNIDGSVVLAINRSELADEQKHIISSEDAGNDSKLPAIKSKEANIVVNEVEVNHRGFKPIEIVEPVIDELALPPLSQMDSNNTINDEVQNVSQKSSDNIKGSRLFTTKSKIKRRIEIGNEEMEGGKRRADEKSSDASSQDPATLVGEDSKRTSKEQGVAKSQSVFSRGLKRLFKKRSSVVDSVSSNNDVPDLAENLSKNDGSSNAIETESNFKSKRSKSEQDPSDIHFAVFNATSESKLSPNSHETSKSGSKVSLLQSVAKKSVDVLSEVRSTADERSTSKSKSPKKHHEIGSFVTLTSSETHTATIFPKQGNPDAETCGIQDQNAAQKRSRSKIEFKEFGLNPSFGSRRSTIVMMATPDPPRREPQTEETRSSDHPQNDSSSSPTACYYLLGPSLDEALVDVRVVFQNLIDKITGKNR